MLLVNWILFGEQLLEKEEDFKLVNCREWCVWLYQLYNKSNKNRTSSYGGTEASFCLLLLPATILDKIKLMEHLDYPSSHFNDAKMAQVALRTSDLHHCLGGRGLIVPFYLSKIGILDKTNGTSGPPLSPFQWCQNGMFCLMSVLGVGVIVPFIPSKIVVPNNFKMFFKCKSGESPAEFSLQKKKGHAPRPLG